MVSAIIISLTVIGILITSYIMYSHANNKKVICPSFSKNCNIVLDSKWSKIFGVKNEIFGFLYYLFIFTITGLAVSTPKIILATKGIVSIAAIYSIFLIYIQSKKLGHFCFYCICTAIVNLLLFFMIAIFNQSII